MRNLGHAAAAVLAISFSLLGPLASASAAGSPGRIAAAAAGQSVAITGTVDGSTAAIDLGNGLFPGTLVGHLDGNTIIGQIQVTNSLGGGTVILHFTLTPI